MQLTIRSEEWEPPQALTVDGARLTFGDLSDYRGVPGLYLIEALHQGGDRCRYWYVGQASNLTSRFQQYQRNSEGPYADANNTTERIGRLFREWVCKPGYTAHFRVIRRVDVEMPDYLFVPEDHEGDEEELAMHCSLENTGLRLFAEAAAILDRDERSTGRWEKRLNRLPRMKGTKPQPSTLDALFPIVFDAELPEEVE